MANLSPYLARIISSEDKPLFEEAVNCATAGSRRATYVMIWLACAESLKRRFREAQRRDGAAGKIVGKFEQMEKDQKAVDRFLLEKAKEYGFLSDGAFPLLLHVYEMRCVYGHPYEAAPSDEQILNAAAVAVDHILSHPVTLKHGFVQTLLESLLKDKAYLDDQQEAVKLFADEILPRIDDSILPWMLDKYWSELEKFAFDASLKTFTWRGVWFTREILNQKGAYLMTHDQWHAKVAAYPVSLIRVVRYGEVFAGIGQLAQDSLLGRLIDLSQNGRSSLLLNFERLLIEEVLTERQSQRLRDHIDAMDVGRLKSCGLSTKTCIRRVISALASHNYYVQNPAVRFVVANGSEQVAELATEDQLILGRNILQAAEGNAGHCISFLRDLQGSGDKWPDDLVRGMALECFSNEADQIRFKSTHLGMVMSILNDKGEEFAATVTGEISGSLRRGTPKHEWLRQRQFKEPLETVQTYTWSNDLVEALKEVAGRIPKEEDDE